MIGKTTQLILMFLPLALGLVAVSLGIMDLKHPVVQVDSCSVVGRGPGIQKFKATARVLYKVSDEPTKDIGLHCSDLGNVLVNDDVPLPFKPGETAWLRIKRYQYFPQRYYFELPVVNPKEAAALQADKAAAATDGAPKSIR